MAQEYSKGFYNSKKWLRCRDAFMINKLYICERCGRHATIAHHKKYITDKNIINPEITLNWNNLEALCIDCHNREHNSTEATAEGIKFDSLGNVLYSSSGQK